MIKGTKTVTTNGFTFEYIPSMRVLGACEYPLVENMARSTRRVRPKVTATNSVI